MKKSDKSIHVCLVSHQTIANIVPLLLEKPVMAILLETEGMQVQADRIASILQPRGIRTERIVIRPYDFDSVETACETICQKYDDHDLTLNVTGGTKISALAAFETFYSTGKRIIYLNTAADELLVISPEAESIPVPNVVNVRTYLAAYGMRQKEDTRGIPEKAVTDRRKNTLDLSPLLIGRPDLVSSLNKATAPYNQRMLPHKYVSFRRDDLGAEQDLIRDLLTACGLAVAAVDGGLNVNTVEACRYLSGGWLEEYVYHTVRGLNLKGLDVRLNVEVRWGRSSTILTTTNEFDVLFTYRNRLHIVSCKTGDLDRKTADGTRGKEALYELDSLADKAGGTFARAMLTSVRPLSKTSRTRARRINIEVVDGRKLLTLAAILKDWIST